MNTKYDTLAPGHVVSAHVMLLLLLYSENNLWFHNSGCTARSLGHFVPQDKFEVATFPFCFQLSFSKSTLNLILFVSSSV
jgi:hypothetical protein